MRAVGGEGGRVMIRVPPHLVLPPLLYIECCTEQANFEHNIWVSSSIGALLFHSPVLRIGGSFFPCLKVLLRLYTVHL